MTPAAPGPSLAAKLGIKPGTAALLSGAPKGFDLGPVPASAVVHRRSARGSYDVGLLFAVELEELVTRWEVMHRLVTPAGRLWVAWPKRASGVATELGEGLVREHGLSHGRVDVKICAVDETWSGLAFVVRLRDR